MYLDKITIFLYKKILLYIRLYNIIQSLIFFDRSNFIHIFNLLHNVTYNHVIIISIIFDRDPFQFRNHLFCFFTTSVIFTIDDLKTIQRECHAIKIQPKEEIKVYKTEKRIVNYKPRFMQYLHHNDAFHMLITHMYWLIPNLSIINHPLLQIESISYIYNLNILYACINFISSCHKLEQLRNTTLYCQLSFLLNISYTSLFHIQGLSSSLNYLRQVFLNYSELKGFVPRQGGYERKIPPRECEGLESL